MTLGLQYGSVALAPHSEPWSSEFARERVRLVRALAGHVLAIEHIGSTAVPGLDAKPILDIGICVADERTLAALIPLICGIGYRFRGDMGSDGGHLFVREERPAFRTHHLHLVAEGDPQWLNYLLLRDLLRRSPVARERYMLRKRELASLHATDRRAYTAGKCEVICALIEEAHGSARQ